MNKTGFKLSRRSVEDYFAWRVERVKPAVERVEKIRTLRGLKILDIGCGYGSLSAVLASAGAIVEGIEIDENKLSIARHLLKDSPRVNLRKGEDEILPFPDQCFDCVFIFDVIEHIRQPEITIRECSRVLKSGGLLYVEFTPYYSIVGHHLYDFAKWPIHLLPEAWIRKVVYSKPIQGFMNHDYFWDQYLGLNKLRISEFQRFVAQYEKICEHFIVKYPDKFEINIPFLNWLGPLKDLFCMSYEGIFVKQTNHGGITH